MDKSKFTRRERRRMRRGRFRFFKNLIIWFIGVLSCIPLLVGGIFSALYYIPLKDLTGGAESGKVSDRVSDTSIVELFMDIEKYGMEDLPIVIDLMDDIIEENGLDEFVAIDREKLSTLKFDANFTQEIQSCFTVVASLNSVGATSMLGDLAGLEIFTWRVAPEYDEGAETFNHKLYYYNNGTKYVPAYKVENDTVVKVASESDTIYCANLGEIPITEVADLIDESLSGVKIVNLLEVAGGVPVEQGSLVNALLGDTTISGLATFNADNITLDVVLPREDELGNPQNQEIYKILDSAITDANADGKIQISELDSLNVNNVSLEVVLSKTDAPDVYEILEAVVTDANADGQIQIGELGSFNIDNFSLEVVLPREDELGNPQNQDIYELLDSAITDVNSDGKIQVSELQTLNVDNLLNTFTLEDFLPREDEFGNKQNEDLYKILDGAITDTNADGKIQIDELETLDFDKVIDEFSLEDFLPREDEFGNKKNEDIYKFLDGAVVDANADGKIQFNELDSLNIDNIDLETILPRADAPEVYKILDSALGIDALDGIQISELSKIDIDNVSLDIVLPRQDELGNAINTDIYKILDSAVTDTNGDGVIQVGELTTLKADNIDLEVILPRADAPDVYKILDSALGTDALDGIQISELSNIVIDNIDLETVLPRQDKDGNAINTDIYKILDLAVNKGSDGIIQVGELATLNVLNIELEAVLKRADAPEIYKILDSALNKTAGDVILVGELNALKIDNIALETVLPKQDKDGNAINTDIYNILDLAVNKGSDGIIQVGELATLNVSNIELEAVLKRADAPEIYKILDSALNKTAGDIILIGELNTLKIDNITLETVLPRQDKDGNAINVDIYKILESALNKTAGSSIKIGELSGFNVGTITLESVLKREDVKNKPIYDILDSALGTKVNDGIQISELSEFNVEEISLESVLKRDDAKNDTIYNILDSALGTKANDGVQIKELSNFEVDNISLETVLKRADAPEVYKILDSALGKTSGQTITIGELSDLKINDLGLEAVLPRQDALGNATNSALYSILDSALTDTNGDGKIQVGELSTLEMGKIVLSKVIPHNEENAKLYKVLEDLYGASVDEITLDKLHDFNTENLHLGVALPRATHEKLYEVLESAITLPEGIEKIENIRLGDLDSCFNKEDIKIEKVIGQNDELAIILQDIYAKPYEKVSMGDLKNFDMSSVKLSSVLDPTGNAMLDKLIEKDVTIGELGREIGELTLYEVYGESCFTTTPVAGAQRFTKTFVGEKVVYTLDDEGEYYLSGDSGIWILVCFDAVTDATGRATKYTSSLASVDDLQNDSSVISNSFINATVRQLVDVGIIESANESIMAYTIEDVIDLLGEKLG